MESGACALITLTSTKHALKIHSDQVVDSTAGSELLCFLDAYSRYHQVSLAEFDCIKTSFIMPFGAYCYITMPFRLKNAGATYQRAMQSTCMINSDATWKHMLMMFSS